MTDLATVAPCPARWCIPVAGRSRRVGEFDFQFENGSEAPPLDGEGLAGPVAPAGPPYQNSLISPA